MLGVLCGLAGALWGNLDVAALPLPPRLQRTLAVLQARWTLFIFQEADTAMHQFAGAVVASAACWLRDGASAWIARPWLETQPLITLMA